ncbi:MAG: macro domain-containing protein [Chloroflexi bacterium]|nr:macro domain-containing protein [Chloroflexota bacterium]
MQRYVIGQATFELVAGDIVVQQVDAIVNAANTTLRPGGGVSGAIHRAAGAELAAACAVVGACETGAACITPGYRLAARYVIHAVGPRYTGRERDAALLCAAYRASLHLADAHGLQSVAFPSISTGIFGYPLDAAARLALTTIAEALALPTSVRLVRMVLWDAETRRAYEYAAEKAGFTATAG